MRIEFYGRVSKKGRTEYVAIPYGVRGGTSLFGKKVHVIIEVVDNDGGVGEGVKTQ